MIKMTADEILKDEDFKALARRKNAMSLILTAAQLVLYFGFIALIAFNKPFLARKLAEGKAMTVGIPIAVLTILLSWGLTGIYIFWANNRHDVRVRKMKDRIGA